MDSFIFNVECETIFQNFFKGNMETVNSFVTYQGKLAENNTILLDIKDKA